MKRLLNIITKKSTTALILFLFEVLISLIFVFFIFGGGFLVFGVFAYIFNVAVMFLIVNKKANPAYKISWIFAVILLPVVGGFLYLTFGKRRTLKKIRKSFMSNKNNNYVNSKDIENFIKNIKIDDSCLQMVKWIFNVSKQGIYSKTKTEFLSSGDLYFKKLICDLQLAKKSIFLEFFIISPGKMWDTILSILIEKAKNGVDIRLIYDDCGTIITLPKNYDLYINKLGIKCYVFNPVKPRLEAFMNNRDHRKIVVIDGKISYTGGINLADEYINEIEKFGYWQDCAVRLEGEASLSFVTLFLNMWNYLSGENLCYKNYISKDFEQQDDGLVMPFGDNPVSFYYLNDSIYLKIINRAKKYVYIETPYLVIDDKLISSLTFAAQSGVEVIIITPHIYDKFYVHALTRSHYKRLIESGVKIYEFTPGFIHSKLIISDDVVGVLGTANFDFRSLYLHFECSVWMYKTKALDQIYKDFKNVISKSRRISIQDCKKRGFFEKLVGFILKPFASFL